MKVARHPPQGPFPQHSFPAFLAFTEAHDIILYYRSSRLQRGRQPPFTTNVLQPQAETQPFLSLRVTTLHPSAAVDGKDGNAQNDPMDTPILTGGTRICTTAAFGFGNDCE